jgi:hypothetical protein
VVRSGLTHLQAPGSAALFCWGLGLLGRPPPPGHWRTTAGLLQARCLLLLSGKILLYWKGAGAGRQEEWGCCCVVGSGPAGWLCQVPVGGTAAGQVFAWGGAGAEGHTRKGLGQAASPWAPEDSSSTAAGQVGGLVCVCRGGEQE